MKRLLRSLAGPALDLVLRAGRALPPDLAWRLGGGLGTLFGSLPIRDVGRAQRHLALAYPLATPGWCRRTARASFRHVFAMALWTLTRLHVPPRRLARGIAIEGRNHLCDLVRASRAGEGTVVYTGHFGNWELLARLVGPHLPTAVVGRKLRDPALDRIVRRLRTETGAIQIDQQAGPRPCIRALRQGRVLACLADQDVPRLAGVFVPWFGIPAHTPAGPALLAIMARVAVQPVFCYRRAGRWVLHAGPRQAPQRSAERAEEVERITAWATTWQERLVRRRPEQWVWWHPRWRTRPQG